MLNPVFDFNQFQDLVVAVTGGGKNGPTGGVGYHVTMAFARARAHFIDSAGVSAQRLAERVAACLSAAAATRRSRAAVLPQRTRTGARPRCAPSRGIATA